MHDSSKPFLSRLARDKSGNTLVLMTAAIIPLAGIVGGAVDASRMYLTKTRLQHACDAGALAGRRQMGAGAWDHDGNRAKVIADQFFYNNFQKGSYGTGALTHSFSEDAGKVSGTARVQVPMTLMRIFGVDSKELAVTCDAELRLPNIDVMFVLDVTGSMTSDPDGNPVGGGATSRIAILRYAAKCFYEQVARLDISDVTCPGAVTTGTGGRVQIRFGFVPYSTGVNVARLITSNGVDQAPDSMVARVWNYQTRYADYSTLDTSGDTETIETWTEPRSNNHLAKNDCANWGRNQPFKYEAVEYQWTPNPSGNPVIADGKKKTYWNDVDNSDWWGGKSVPTGGQDRRTCKRRVRTTYEPARYKFTKWIYKQDELDLGTIVPGGTLRYLNGTGGYVTKPGIYSPINIFNAPGASGLPEANWTWKGCIEERETVSASSYYPRPAGAYDLDIDGFPSAADHVKRQWKVALDGGPIYVRGTKIQDGGFNEDRANSQTWNSPLFVYDEVETTVQNPGWPNPNTSCPTEAAKLQTWSADAFRNYVNGLNPAGGTYHDIGLLWGARLISPDGMYAATNRQTEDGGNIERHVIFMTDGQTEEGANKAYGTYGHRWYDRRFFPKDHGSPTLGQQREQIDKRTAALCSMVRNKNITLWTVVFGNKDSSKSGLNQAIIDNMNTCATPNRAYVAKDRTALVNAFNSIAAQIAQLRLTN